MRKDCYKQFEKFYDKRITQTVLCPTHLYELFGSTVVRVFYKYINFIVMRHPAHFIWFLSSQVLELTFRSFPLELFL